MTTTTAPTTSALSATDLADIQAIVPYGSRLRRQRYLFFAVSDRSRARRFVASFVPGQPLAIATAVPRAGTMRPTQRLQIAFTAAGLSALGVDLRTFPSEFVMGARERAIEIGDTGASAPDHWTLPHDRLHIAVLVFADTQDDLQALADQVLAAAEHGCELVCQLDGQVLESADDDRREGPRFEHFGFLDGISQPRIRMAVPGQGGPLPGGVAPGLFVLGHPDHASPMNASLTLDPLPEPARLTRNGTFGAFRIIEQDRDAFDAFLEQNAPPDDQVARELLAAKLVGRFRDGTPLALSDTPLNEVPGNQFDYRNDPRGLRCPIGSHVRRANPRSTEVLGGNGAAVPLIRRGIPYGPPHRPNDGQQRGLLGLFLCASLKHQFEFIMKHWINDGLFARGLSSDERDPLVGAPGGPPSRFTYPVDHGKDVEVQGVGSFTKTRGAAYLFFPAVNGLRSLASDVDQPVPVAAASKAAPPAAAASPVPLTTDDGRIAAITAPILEKVTRTRRRDAHANHHGIVKASFEVCRDIPEGCRVGLFATPGRYDAWIRFSNGLVPATGEQPFQHDALPDARGMAIKLLNVSGTRLLSGGDVEQSTQDFILVNHPTFFARNLTHYLQIVGTPQERLPELFPHVLACFHSHANVLSTRYFSQTAYRLGDRGVVRYSARPLQPAEQPPLSPHEMRERLTGDAHYLRAAMTAHLEAADAEFEFLLQVPQRPDTVTVEDPMTDWNEPYVAVARITIPKQSFSGEARMRVAERISYNPWNGLVEHEPLGSINRARRDLYLASATIRTHTGPLSESELQRAFTHS